MAFHRSRDAKRRIIEKVAMLSISPSLKIALFLLVLGLLLLP